MCDRGHKVFMFLNRLKMFLRKIKYKSCKSYARNSSEKEPREKNVTESKVTLRSGRRRILRQSESAETWRSLVTLQSAVSVLCSGLKADLKNLKMC